MDILVIVNTEWTGPDGLTTTNTAQPVMGSTTTYTSTVMVSSFGRDKSGNYRCRATVSPNPSLSMFLMGGGSRLEIVKVTAGMTTKLLSILICMVPLSLISQVSISLIMKNSLNMIVSSSSLTLGHHHLTSWSVSQTRGLVV